MTGLLCIYHGFCDDGFAAAWCARQAFATPESVEFYPGVYQKEPPNPAGRDVILVDFSYKAPVLEAMARTARSILILDHHKTAEADLADWPLAPSWENWRGLPPTTGGARRGALFDMKRSGAGISWDYFHGGNRPAFIDYIEDRDLWLKKLPGGDEFTIALRSYPQDFEVWDRLVDDGPDPLIAEGKSIQRYYRLRIEELKRSAYPASLSGHRIMAANAPYFAASEVAGELAQLNGAEFGACYFEVSAGRWQYSLRSRGDFDVSAIALQFGGGGHPGAAGFTADRPVHTALAVAPGDKAA